VKPVKIRERPFVLEALVFLERVRGLTDKGLEVTGGPMEKAGEIFDLLDAVCDAFEPDGEGAGGGSVGEEKVKLGAANWEWVIINVHRTT